MPATSMNTSMDSWLSSGWVVGPIYSLGIIDTPPPQAADKFAVEIHPPEANLGDLIQVMEPEECLEFAEDLLTAEEAEREHEAHGAEGTISYTEYRNMRLGSTP